MTGNFTFQVKVKASFTKLYDQAGIMVMTDEDHWLKSGMEYNDGAPAIGSVLVLGTLTGQPVCFPEVPTCFGCV